MGTFRRNSWQAGTFPESTPDTPTRQGSRSARPKDRAFGYQVESSDLHDGGCAVSKPHHCIRNHGLRTDDETSVSRAIKHNMAFSACPRMDWPNQVINENQSIYCTYLKNGKIWDITLS